MKTSSTALLALSLTLAPLVTACDPSTGDDAYDLDVLDEEEEALDDLAAEQPDETDPPASDEAPASTDIVTLYSSAEDQLADDITLDGEAPTIDRFADAIGIGPDDVPMLGGDLTAAVDDTAALGLRYEGSFSFGGNLWGMSYDIIRGPSSCGAGKTRAFAHAYVEGQGSCYVAGWYSFDPTDCRIRVRVNQPGWFGGGVCRMFVYDQ